jgi:hypothetical protein
MESLLVVSAGLWVVTLCRLVGRQTFEENLRPEVGGSMFLRNVGICLQFEESCFRTLSIVQCFFSLKTTFRKLALLPSSGKKRGGGVAPTLWGPLEIANLNHWTMDKVLKQYSSKCITPSSEPFRIELLTR